MLELVQTSKKGGGGAKNFTEEIAYFCGAEVSGRHRWFLIFSRWYYLFYAQNAPKNMQTNDERLFSVTSRQKYQNNEF